jgi:DNA-binding LytR/AlgR family response regulator
MYKVVLCEDEEFFSNEQERICREIFERHGIEYHINVFPNGKAFFSAFPKHENLFDLILLDIVMDGMNGIEIARKIRETDKNVVIIFITSNQDYALQGYEVNAFHYLIKPIDVFVLENLILTAYNDKFNDRIIIIKMGEQRFRIPLNDIVCLETAGRRVAVTTFDKTVYYSGKLTELLLELPKDRFVRCHQAFAVNVRNIRELNRQDAVAVTGRIIPVSRTYMGDTKNAFLRYLREI